MTLATNHCHYKGKVSQDYKHSAISSEDEENVSLDVVCNELSIDDLQCKHPLQNSWTLWFRDTDINKGWSQNLIKVSDIATVEEFWSVIQVIATPFHLPPGSDYFFFQQGIQPSWEDVQNKAGGQWMIALDKVERVTLLDKFWHELLLTVISDEFDDTTDYIAGLVASTRNRYARIGVWIKGSASEGIVRNIGNCIRDKIAPEIQRPIDYSLHSDVENKQNSKPKSIFTV